MSGDNYVTKGDTPNCDHCRKYYSERRCEDCDKYLCTWCNLELHEPIGARNHHRPRLYGEDPYAHLEAPAVASADRIIEEQLRALRGEADSAAQAAAEAKFTVDGSGRVSVTTEHHLPISAEDAWDLLGDWDVPFVPFSVDANEEGDRRVLSLPAGEDGEDTLLVTEKLIQRDEREMFYSYSRSVANEPRFPFTDLMSKFQFVPVPSSSGRGRHCMLQWTSSVMPREEVQPKEAAEAVAQFQESWTPHMEAAIQMED